MELLQCHVAAWQVPYEESNEQAVVSHRLLATTARLLAGLADASAQEWSASDGATCAAHLAWMKTDTTWPVAPLAAADEEDEAEPQVPASSLLGAYQWLSETLRARGVDVPNAEPATAAGKESDQ